MSRTICIILLIGLLSCRSQTKSSPKTIIIEDFNWIVTIPENFNSVKEADWDKIEKKGETAIEKTIGEDIINEAVTIFTYKNEQFNTFEANWQPFDTEIDGEYSETSSEVNKIIYRTFETQIPNVKLDSISSMQKVSGLDFHRFDIAIDFPNGIKMKTIGFSRLFGKKEFTMNITYVDEQIGKKMLDAFLSSEFK